MDGGNGIHYTSDEEHIQKVSFTDTTGDYSIKSKTPHTHNALEQRAQPDTRIDWVKDFKKSDQINRKFIFNEKEWRGRFLYTSHF